MDVPYLLYSHSNGPNGLSLVECELTAVQKTYYRAIFEKNTGFLYRGVRRPVYPLESLPRVRMRTTR